jgi:hypothetical protein
VVTPGSAAPPEVQYAAPGDDARLAHLKADSYGTKVYHGILNALGGAQDVSYSIDPATGKMVQSTVASGPGTQWKRIISGALTGYAAGAGLTGPGSTAAKFGRGIQAGQQQAQQQDQSKRQEATEDYERGQKLATTNLQRSLLTQQVTEASFRNTRSQIEAAEHDSENMNKFHDLIVAGGAGTKNMGHFDSPEAVRAAFDNDPTLHDSHVQGRIVSIPHVNEQGKLEGVDAAYVTKGWLDATYKNDLPVTVKGWKDGKATEETFTIPGGSITNDKASQIIMSQGKDSMDQHWKETSEQRAGEEAKAKEAGEYAGAGEHRATTRKTNLESDVLEKTGELPGTAGKGGGVIAPEDMPATVQAVGQGRVGLGDLNRLLAKNPGLAEEIAKTYPDFRSGAAKNFDKQYANFTSGQTGGALNAAGTSAQHLTRLMQMNTTASHIPGTPAYRAYQAQVLPAAEELSKYYGGGKGSVTLTQHYEKILGGIGPGREDAIWTTAGALADKFSEYQQQWQNALPSKSWSIPMPTVTPEALADLKAVEDHLAQHDPKYVRRLPVTQPQVRPAPNAMGAGATPQQSPVNTGATPQLPDAAMATLRAAAGKPVAFKGKGVWAISQSGQAYKVSD